MEWRELGWEREEVEGARVGEGGGGRSSGGSSSLHLLPLPPYM